MIFACLYLSDNNYLQQFLSHKHTKVTKTKRLEKQKQLPCKLIQTNAEIMEYNNNFWAKFKDFYNSYVTSSSDV